MHIVVIGAGIVGMATAYCLHQEGYKVTVIDAGAGPGLLTSKANGAQLSYSFVAPLADPAVLPKIPSWIADKDGPLGVKLQADAGFWRWVMAFLGACTKTRVQRTTAELLLLGRLSRQQMHMLVAHERLDFDFSSTGKLLVYQDDNAFQKALKQVDYQERLGCEQQVLSTKQCLDLEPALSDVSHKVVGGIFTPSEDAGDCYKLCLELMRILQARPDPVHFLFNTRVNKIKVSQGRVMGLETGADTIQADGYVLANGIGAQVLARQVGINPLIYPLKGYSLTYELTDDSFAPMVSLSDVHNKVVYARIGNRLRVAGMVEIGEHSHEINANRINSLKQQVARYLHHLFPAGEPQAWAGMRPARPDSKPVIGRTPYPNLWMNVGHGTLGFTLAAGSARLLTDLMVGRESPFAQSFAL